MRGEAFYSVERLFEAGEHVGGEPEGVCPGGDGWLQHPAVSASLGQFLRRLGQPTGVALTTSLLDGLHALVPPDRPLHVVIRGAGLAVLIGGRVRTLRFEDGLYGEGGAMRIPFDHTLTRYYVNAFGLPLLPFVQANSEAYYYVRGQRERIKHVPHLRRLYALQEAEREKTPDDP
jgi:hypothetical protein